MLGEPKCTETDLSFGANLTQIWCQIWHLWWMDLRISLHCNTWRYLHTAVWVIILCLWGFSMLINNCWCGRGHFWCGYTDVFVTTRITIILVVCVSFFSWESVGFVIIATFTYDTLYFTHCVGYWLIANKVLSYTEWSLYHWLYDLCINKSCTYCWPITYEMCGGFVIRKTN